MTLYVHGLGHFHPENEITNKFLESLDIGTSDEWIMERVGIRSRRTVLPLDYIRETRNADPREAERVNVYDNGQLGARAAKLAVERAGISMSDIGMVIGGGCAPDFAISPVRGLPGIAEPSSSIEAPVLRPQLRLHELLRRPCACSVDDATPTKMPRLHPRCSPWR